MTYLPKDGHMANYGAVLAWSSPRQGREAKALEVFVEAQATYEKAQANGLIDSFETVLFQATAGALPGGMTTAWGSEDQMDAWRRNEDYTRLQAQASLVADGVAVTDCIRGEAIMDGMTNYAELIATVT